MVSETLSTLEVCLCDMGFPLTVGLATLFRFLSLYSPNCCSFCGGETDVLLRSANGIDDKVQEDPARTPQRV